MYVYIVDSFVQQKYAKELATVQARVQDLGMSGRFEKLTILKNIKEIVGDAEKKGIKTVVAIGNDATLTSVISSLSNYNTTVGYIPFGSDHVDLAHSLHIPGGEQACLTLSKRIIHKLDVGKVNGRYFFSSLEIPQSQNLKLEFEHSYQLICEGGASFQIVNFSPTLEAGQARDGMLKAIVNEPESGGFLSFFSRKKSLQSILPVKHLSIKSGIESVPIFSEGSMLVKTPAEIDVVPSTLRLIVGA